MLQNHFPSGTKNIFAHQNINSANQAMCSSTTVAALAVMIEDDNYIDKPKLISSLYQRQ